MTLLCASVPYAEIVFFVILALALVLGICRGFSKSFKGFSLTVVIVLLSLFLVSPTLKNDKISGLFDGLNNTITQKISSTEILATPIYIEEHVAEDGSVTTLYFVNVEVEGSMQRVQLEEAMNQGGIVGGIKGKLFTWLVNTFVKEDGQTIGGVAGRFITNILSLVIVFLIYLIVLSLVCVLIRKFTKGMHKSEIGWVKVIDRSLGAVISTALAFIALLIVLAILTKLAQKYPVINEYLGTSVVKKLSEVNPITTLWTKFFG